WNARGSAPAEKQDADHEQVREIGEDLGEGGLRAVADEAREEAAGHALVADQPRGVPDGLGEWQEPEALEPADAARGQAGGEEQDGGGGGGKEARQADGAPAGEAPPAEGPPHRSARHAAEHARPPRRPFRLGHDPPEEEDRLRALAEDAREGDEPDDPQP